VDGTSPVGWLCLLPPLLTIALAIITRRVVLSLLLGIAVAVIVMLPTYASQSDVEPASGLAYGWQMTGLFAGSFFETHLWGALFDEDHLRVFAFTCILGMQVALIHRSGGMHGIVQWAAPLARSRRGGQVLTWLLGMVIFIDDYANTLLLGSTMRPLTDRLRISREKLAFLVDSTAAPVSGLALVSTWVATEISTMQVGYASAGIDVGGDTFGLFIQTIPSRFYILYTLAFVLFCGLLCRDFGPMLTAERKAQTQDLEDEQSPSGESITPRALNAILPILVTIAVVVWLLIATGLSSLAEGTIVQPTLQSWGQVIGQGNSYLALVYGALSGLLVVLLLSWRQRCLRADEMRSAMLSGFLHVLPAMVILWLAWTLSGLTGNENMRTGEFIAGKVSQWNMNVGFMPTIVFLLASGIAFATGTSWGTMTILMPIIIPLVYGLLSQQQTELPPPNHFVLIASIGSVLAGSILGDHCSPISDTTILSSRSSSCDHIAHVRTQMPYALCIGLVSIVLGTLPAGFGIQSWILLPIGLVALWLILLAFGRSATPE
jgi:Na+/H+ antiporter NhaC